MLLLQFLGEATLLRVDALELKFVHLDLVVCSLAAFSMGSHVLRGQLSEALLVRKSFLVLLPVDSVLQTSELACIVGYLQSLFVLCLSALIHLLLEEGPQV